jgi:HAD superfamily hydrolase (TIGR01509 family)
VSPAPRPAAVFLDAGGVLVDPDWERIAAVAAGAGVRAEPAALRLAEPVAKRSLDESSSVGTTDDRRRGDLFLRRTLAGSGASGSPAAVDAALDALAAEHARENLWCRVPATVPAALRRLRDSGRRLVVVSNADGSVARTLERAGLLPFFHAVVDSGVVGFEKPDPRIFHAALRAAAVRPQDAVHVGDFHEIDVVGARNAGIAPVLIDPADLRTGAACPRFPDLDAFVRDLLRLPPPRSASRAR